MNADEPMVSTLPGMVTLMRLVQPSNVLLEITLRVLPIVRFSRLVQPEKAPSSKVSVLLGMATALRCEHPSKAW